MIRQSERLGLLERAAGLVLGLYLAGIGIDGVSSGRLAYQNYFGWTVHAPTALVIGLLILFAFSNDWIRLRK